VVTEFGGDSMSVYRHRHCARAVGGNYSAEANVGGTERGSRYNMHPIGRVVLNIITSGHW